MPLIVILLFMVIMITPPRYNMSDVMVYYRTHEEINDILTMCEGDHPEVIAFALRIGGKYYIFFPHNPASHIIRHEYQHIIDWKNEERLVDN